MKTVAMVSALALLGWTVLRLSGRVARLEAVHGNGWSVQDPQRPAWDADSWWASDEFDRALVAWQRDQRDDVA